MHHQCWLEAAKAARAAEATTRIHRVQYVKAPRENTKRPIGNTSAKRRGRQSAYAMATRHLEIVYIDRRQSPNGWAVEESWRGGLPTAKCRMPSVLIASMRGNRCLGRHARGHRFAWGLGLGRAYSIPSPSGAFRLWGLGLEGAYSIPSPSGARKVLAHGC